MEIAERLERPEVKEGKLLTDKNLHILNIICFVSMMSNALSSSYTLISDTFNVTANQVGMMNTLYSTPMLQTTEWKHPLLFFCQTDPQ